MNSRLKDIRKALRLTQKEFAARLGITDSGISRLEKGQNQLTDQLIRAICREYKVNYEYLKNGIGEMFVEVPQTVVDELCEQYDLDDFDRIMLQEYLKMDEASRNVLKTYIRKICGQISEVDDTQSKIDAEVESYRQELELEARQAGESSASDTPAENMA
jgi:transcriptional regulator with XRE-family HTH domain